MTDADDSKSDEGRDQPARQTRCPTHFAGVGASAGGLEVLARH